MLVQLERASIEPWIGNQVSHCDIGMLHKIAAHLIAPYAKIIISATPADTEITGGPAENVAMPEIMKGVEFISSHHLADVMSISDGSGETTYSAGPAQITAQSAAELTAAANGVPVLGATGDCGVVQNLAVASGQCQNTSPTPDTAAWDDSPWVTAVGGSVPNLGPTDGQRLGPDARLLRTLDGLVQSGKVRYIACSNFSGWHLMKSLAVSDRYGWTRYVAHQAYYSLIGRDYEWELMPLALDQKVGAVVWSPLGWGRLTGKIRRGAPLPKESRLHKTADYGPQVDDEYLYTVMDALDEVAEETGKTVPQIALNWLLQRPTVAR